MKSIRFLVIFLASLSLSMGLISDNTRAYSDKVATATTSPYIGEQVQLPAPVPCQTLHWCRHATKISGRVSTYGGPHDSGDNNRPALSGASNRSPGIAVFNRRTLGGYWLVIYNRIQHVVRQTDIGPAPWTRRVIDFNPPAAKRFYGIVTDRLGRATYLGRDRARALLRALTIKRR